MNHFVIVITSDKPFDAERHPAFFKHMLSKPRSVRISEDTFCFCDVLGLTAVRAELEHHLKGNDEFALFQVVRAIWGTSRNDFDLRMKDVFQP